MRIDTDLVTYLSHVILPEQLVQSQLQSTQMLHHLQMQMVDDAKQSITFNHPNESGKVTLDENAAGGHIGTS